MTILVAVKKKGRVFLGADRITTFGNEYFTDLVNAGKIIKLKHAYLATSGYTLLDNVLEHLHATNHKIMENKFQGRADVFQFFLELYAELKKQYTLVDTGKETYAGIYNVFLIVTSTNIYGVSNNLSVTEYPYYAAKGAGSDYSLGCLYALYDTIDDVHELTRLALEAACHFCIYCREPLDIIEVKESDFGKLGKSYKDHGKSLVTVDRRTGLVGSLVTSRKTPKEAIAEATKKQPAAKTTKTARKTTQTKKPATSKASATKKTVRKK